MRAGYTKGSASAACAKPCFVGSADGRVAGFGRQDRPAGLVSRVRESLQKCEPRPARESAHTRKLEHARRWRANLRHAGVVAPTRRTRGTPQQAPRIQCSSPTPSAWDSVARHCRACSGLITPLRGACAIQRNANIAEIYGLSTLGYSNEAALRAPRSLDWCFRRDGAPDVLPQDQRCAASDRSRCLTHAGNRSTSWAPSAREDRFRMILVSRIAAGLLRRPRTPSWSLKLPRVVTPTPVADWHAASYA